MEDSGSSQAPQASGNMGPPSLAPLQTNQIPGAIPGGPATAGGETPMSAGGTVRRAAPEPNKRALYVGGLDPRVTEDVLRQIFETAGHVIAVKIIPDKNVRLPYLFLRTRDAMPSRHAPAPIAL